jgi:NAD(P)H dehydrogenase (quinone)
VKVSVILAHPKEGSFNHAIAGTVVSTLKKNRHEVRYHDLYEENFDPILPGEEILKSASLGPNIQQHCTEISEAEGIVIVHPNWWGQPPAILKGWMDRVLRPGIAYAFKEDDTGEGIPVGLLNARAALIFNTSNTPDERERAVFGDPLEALWKDCVFDLCGVKSVHRRMFGVMVTSTLQQRHQWLEEVRTTVDRYFPHLQ